MNMIDTMIVWTPNTDRYQGSTTAGKVAVTTLPESEETRRYGCSVGACMMWWTDPKADRAMRLEMLQSWIWSMIRHDGVAPTEISRALSEIEDVDADEVIGGIDKHGDAYWLHNLGFIGFAD